MEKEYIGNFEVWWPNKSEKMAVNVNGGQDGYFYIENLDLANKIWSLLSEARAGSLTTKS